MSAKSIKIAVLGNTNVGKSAVTCQFVLGHFVEHFDPTIEDNYQKDMTIGSDEVSLEISDTASVTSEFYEQSLLSADGFLLVFSISSKDSFMNIEPLIQHILKIKQTNRVPMLIVGNKNDLERNREVYKSKVQAFADTLSIPFLECSAKTGTNIIEAFAQLVREVLKPRVIEPALEPVLDEKEVKKSCLIC